MPSQPQDPLPEEVTVTSSQSQRTPISQEENNNEVNKHFSLTFLSIFRSSKFSPRKIEFEAELPGALNSTDNNDDPSEEVNCNPNGKLFIKNIFLPVIQESRINKRAKRSAEDDSATSPTKKAHSEINLEFEKPDDVPDGKIAIFCEQIINKSVF